MKLKISTWSKRELWRRGGGSRLVGGVLFISFFVGIFDFRLCDRHFSVDDLVVFIFLGRSRCPLGDADLSANCSSLFPSFLWLIICDKR